MKSRTLAEYADRLHEENNRLRRENADLRARLAAVRDRCESNNWMGTARLCGNGEVAGGGG